MNRDGPFLPLLSHDSSMCVKENSERKKNPFIFNEKQSLPPFYSLPFLRENLEPTSMVFKRSKPTGKIILSNDKLFGKQIWCFTQSGKAKNTHGGVLLLVKLQVSAYNFTKLKILLLHERFLRFLNCVNSNILRSLSDHYGQSKIFNPFNATSLFLEPLENL